MLGGEAPAGKMDHQLTERSSLTPSSPGKDLSSYPFYFFNSVVDYSGIDELKSLTSTRAHAGLVARKEKWERRFLLLMLVRGEIDSLILRSCWLTC